MGTSVFTIYEVLYNFKVLITKQLSLFFTYHSLSFLVDLEDALIRLNRIIELVTTF